MSDERNRIVTLINHEANPIEIFRQFETQRIELVCFPLKHCYYDGDLRNYQFHSEHEMVTRIVKSALLMGPYRIISYFANETNNKIHRWVDTGNGSTQYLEMTAVFSGRPNKELTGLINALKITITEGQDRNVTLYITQVEPFKRITITKKDGGYIDGLTESIGSRKIFIRDGKLNDRELVYDYKFGMKYTLSGSNECAIELRDAPDKLILVNPDYYGSEAYFQRTRDVITCKTHGDYLCLGIGHGDSLPDEDDNGLDCMVFSNSDQRLTRLSGEAPLKVIEKSYLKLYGSQFRSLGVKFAVVDVTIEDAPEKAKSNSTSVFFFIYSILITIVIFVKLAFDFRLIQRRNYSLRDYVSLKLFKSSI
uniref:Uncharacterized protein n=1 Tax=Tetranychus urticae TaxID=32264 RepID=T1L5Z6_TETUR